MKLKFTFPKEQKGGPGSGHHGHSGRPGQVGGSAAGSGGGSTPPPSSKHNREETEAYMREEWPDVDAPYRLSRGNQAYELPPDKYVWLLSDERQHAGYYGAAAVSSPIYKPMLTGQNDRLLAIAGGNFYLPDGSDEAIKVAFRLPPRAFEHSYGGSEVNHIPIDLTTIPMPRRKVNYV